MHDAGSVIHGRIGPRPPVALEARRRPLAGPPAAGDALDRRRHPRPRQRSLGLARAVGDRRHAADRPRLPAGPPPAASRRAGRLPPCVLAASDTMLIVESRIGVLDPFVALWSALCIYCALRYVQSGRPARWLALTGLAGGLALASKWSGLLALVAAAAIIAVDWRRRDTRRASTAGGRRAQGDGRPCTAGRLARAAACLVALPLVVYVASYADYFASGHTVGQWLHLQGYMASFNWNVQGSSGMASRPLTWIFDADPHLVPLGARAARRPRPDRDRQPAAVVGLGRGLRRPCSGWRGGGATAAWPSRRCWSRSSTCRGWPRAGSRTSTTSRRRSRSSPSSWPPPLPGWPARCRCAAAGRRSALPRAPFSWAWRPAARSPLRLAALAALVAVLVAAVVAVRRRRRRSQRPGAAGDGRLAVHRRRGRPGLAWLPFLVSYAASFGYYERLAWFTTWR